MSDDFFVEEAPDPSVYTLNPAVCKNCPFGNHETAIRLRIEALEDYYKNLFEGGTHMCHNQPSRSVVCRGGRNWQIQVFHRIGWLKAPTHKAYVEYLTELGINSIPRHILDYVEE